MKRSMQEIFVTVFLALGLGTAFILFKMLFVVAQQSAVVVERLGRFVRIAHPGLNFKIPFVERAAGELNLRIVQLDVEVETKTQDDVFVKIIASVQYRVLRDKIYEAFYTLDDPEGQVRSFVFDVVRSRVPHIKLDDVFSKKDDIANSVREELKDVMSEFGYDIIKTLVTDIHPDSKVKAAMNEINEAQRLRVAAMERGEAEKILKVKMAEADSESKILQGQGIAGQRKAIVDGLKESVNEFHDQIPGTSTQDVMHLILMGQYFDTLREMGGHGHMNTILLPHSPSALGDLYTQIREAMIVSHQVNKASKPVKDRHPPRRETT